MLNSHLLYCKTITSLFMFNVMLGAYIESLDVEGMFCVLVFVTRLASRLNMVIK